LCITYQCPHQFVCPLLETNNKCRFDAWYYPFTIYDYKNNNNKHKMSIQYSYIVFHKSRNDQQKKRPRLVLETPKKDKSGRYSCFNCTKDGTVERISCSKNKFKDVRMLLKYSQIGDELPLSYTTPKQEKQQEAKEPEEK
jgi:ribosomal protein RSM22 (predicted rRNA methylase)